MDIKAIKQLAEKFSVSELESCATELENTGSCRCSDKSDAEEIMSDILQSIEVRSLMEQGHSMQDAVREFSRRVRTVLTK